MARPLGSQNKDKPFREALRMEIAALGEDDPKALRGLARNLLRMAAMTEDSLQAIKEVADRLDGKPAQAVSGDDENPIEVLHRIERVIVDPQNRDG